MAQSISIDKQGNVTVDGTVITPEQLVAGATEVDKVWREVANKRNWTLKNGEKVLAYAAALVGATNGFAQFSMNANLRGWIVGAAALVLTGIHVSTPKAN
jgi:hypothetical protein